MSDDLEARLAQAERERDEARARIKWLADTLTAAERARSVSQRGENRMARWLAEASDRTAEAESLVALAMREGLAVVEAERAKTAAMHRRAQQNEGAVARLDTVRSNMQRSINYWSTACCDAQERARQMADHAHEAAARADRLEAACAAMRERLAARVVHWYQGEQFCGICETVSATPNDKPPHTNACPLHPDAGARLLARLEAAERVAEACKRVVEAVQRRHGHEDEGEVCWPLSDACCDASDALAAWRAVKEV